VYSSIDEEYNKVGLDVKDTIYLGLRVYVKIGGILEYGFVDDNDNFLNNIFHVSKALEATNDGYIESISGIWDGVGDFMIKSSGDMYIDVLSLSDNPLENFKITTTTSIEQDAKSIKLIGTKVNDVDGTLTTVQQEVNAQAGSISSLVQQVTSQGSSISSLTVSVGNINSTVSSKVGKNEIISSINQSAEAVTINANKINLNGVVTFSMLNSDMQNTINAKVNTSSIISGGYIKTSLIDVDSLVAKKVITNGDTNGVTTTMADGAIIMKNPASLQLMRLSSSNGGAILQLSDDSSNSILLAPVSSSFSFSNGKSLSVNPANGLEFSGGMGIKRFAISSIYQSLTADGDLCIIGGQNYNMPNASSLTGRVMWVYATRELTLTGSFMNSNGSSASSIKCQGMNFFISDGSKWYRGYCQ
jgi:hypothetical protein